MTKVSSNIPQIIVPSATSNGKEANVTQTSNKESDNLRSSPTQLMDQRKTNETLLRGAMVGEGKTAPKQPTTMPWKTSLLYAAGTLGTVVASASATPRRDDGLSIPGHMPTDQVPVLNHQANYAHKLANPPSNYNELIPRHAFDFDDVPLYAGKKLPGTKPDFFEFNTHSELNGTIPDVARFSHPDYLKAESTKALGLDIMSHRGMIELAKGIPENSMASYNNAYDHGFRSIEMDVAVTKDGVPILMHDFTLGRMTNDPQNRLVSHVSWDEIKDKNLVIRHPLTGDFVETNEKILKLEDVLVDAMNNKPGAGVVADCKEMSGEAVCDLLLKNPELRPHTAIKLYAKVYSGGFDQFLANLYERYGIDPEAESDMGKRQQLLVDLKEIKLVPVFSQVCLTDEKLLELFPSETQEGPRSAQGLAESAMKWLKGWDAMDIKIIEAHSMGPSTVEGEAMGLLNKRLEEENSGLSKAAMSASYRFEDYSVEKEDSSRRYFVWSNFGGTREVTDDSVQKQRETPGSLRDEAESDLTDLAYEEAYAVEHNMELSRGNPGVRVKVAPGTEVDLSRNKENLELREVEFQAEKKPVNPELINKVRAGLRNDGSAGALPPPREEGASGNGWWMAATASLVGVGVVGYLTSGSTIKVCRYIFRSGQKGVNAAIDAAQQFVRRDAAGGEESIPLRSMV